MTQDTLEEINVRIHQTHIRDTETAKAIAGDLVDQGHFAGIEPFSPESGETGCMLIIFDDQAAHAALRTAIQRRLLPDIGS